MPPVRHRQRLLHCYTNHILERLFHGLGVWTGYPDHPFGLLLVGLYEIEVFQNERPWQWTKHHTQIPIYRVICWKEWGLKNPVNKTRRWRGLNDLFSKQRCHRLIFIHIYHYASFSLNSDLKFIFVDTLLDLNSRESMDFNEDLCWRWTTTEITLLLFKMIHPTS